MTDFNSLIDETEFRTVASYLHDQQSPINYVLHSRTLDFLSPLADHFLADLHQHMLTPGQLNAEINHFATEMTLRVSTRYAAPEIAAENRVAVGDVLTHAKSWSLYLPPFCFSHTPGLFEGDVVRPRVGPPPVLPENPVQLAQPQEYNRIPTPFPSHHDLEGRIQQGQIVDLIEHLKHPGSPINYVLHVRHPDMLVPTAQRLRAEFGNPPLPLHAHDSYVNRLPMRLDLLLSARTLSFQLDDRSLLPIADIPRLAKSTYLFDRPFCIAHTPGLFEGRLIRPKTFEPPAPRRSTGIKI